VLKRGTLWVQLPMRSGWTLNSSVKSVCLRITLLSTFPKTCPKRFVKLLSKFGFRDTSSISQSIVDVHAKKVEVGNLAVKVEVFARAEGFAEAKADPAQVEALRAAEENSVRNHPENFETKPRKTSFFTKPLLF
jgi:hypothetical protein